MIRSRTTLMPLIVATALFSLFFSLLNGSTSLSFTRLFSPDNSLSNTILFKLRLPRTFTAFVSGGLLALSGSLMQLLLQNPLADPYALGVSGGAALFTLILMLLGASNEALIGGAWAGSLLSMLLIFLMARKHGFKTHTLLLSGIILACGFSAAISCLLLLSPDSSLHSMLFWLTGDLNATHFPSLAFCILCLGGFFCYALAPGFNLLIRGENEATALGLPTTYYRILLYLLSSLFAATAVTLAGCIGFIGLIVPHLTRRLVGFNHRIMLPAAILLGGSLLTFADTLARTLFAPAQIPVGIIMALIGVPAFIWLLQS